MSYQVYSIWLKPVRLSAECYDKHSAISNCHIYTLFEFTFICHHLLYILSLPEMEPMFLRPFFLSGSIQVFEDDCIHVVLYCLFYDKGRCPYRNIVIDAVCRSPQARHSLCPVFLGFLKPSHCMVQTVVFCRKGKKFPSCDRAVCFHDTAGTGIVDPQVHGKNPGVTDLLFFQFCFFLEGEIQIPLLSPLPQHRDTFFPVPAVTDDIIRIRLP